MCTTDGIPASAATVVKALASSWLSAALRREAAGSGGLVCEMYMDGVDVLPRSPGGAPNCLKVCLRGECDVSLEHMVVASFEASANLDETDVHTHMHNAVLSLLRLCNTESTLCKGEGDVSVGFVSLNWAPTRARSDAQGSVTLWAARFATTPARPILAEDLVGVLRSAASGGSWPSPELRLIEVTPLNDRPIEQQVGNPPTTQAIHLTVLVVVICLGILVVVSAAICLWQSWRRRRRVAIETKNAADSIDVCSSWDDQNLPPAETPF